MSVQLFSQAQRYLGIREIPGEADHPLIRFWHSLCTIGETSDEVAWCSSYVNGVCWQERKARSKSAAARSWLDVGITVERSAAIPGDIVILSRGSSLTAGHVGFFAGWDEPDKVRILGGNQGDTVSIANFDADRILGIRRV